jgi:arylsulfatase A-like enzyme
MMTEKSVVLVTVDCLRADHTGFMGYEKVTTPFLDTLAAESFVFPAAIVAGAPTYYSLPGILASRYPLAFGRDVVGLAPEETNLASAFKQAGYTTAFFGAGNPYISPQYGYDFGFDTFCNFLDTESIAGAGREPVVSNPNAWMSRFNRKLQDIRPRLGSWGMVYDELYFRYCQRRTPPPKSLDALRRFPAADVIVDQARAWMASIGESPFFLWLHLMDPHSPYYPVENALDLMENRSVTASRARYLNSFWNRSDLSAKRLTRHRDEVVALYDAGIRWVDTQMAHLIDTLRHFNIWDRCIFAFTADHGEEFLDHGGRYHPPSRLMEELIRVPLLLRIPGEAKRELQNSPFSMLHLAPTLLDVAGVERPSSFQGQSHWPFLQTATDPPEIAISESIATCTNPARRENRFGPRTMAVREARFKLTSNFATATDYLYDLESDPRELNPLPASAEKATRRRLLERVREHLRQSMVRRDPAKRAQSQLRDLRLQWQFPEAKAS